MIIIQYVFYQESLIIAKQTKTTISVQMVKLLKTKNIILFILQITVHLGKAIID